MLHIKILLLLFLIYSAVSKSLNISETSRENSKKNTKRHVPFSQIPSGFFGQKFGQQLSRFSNMFGDNGYYYEYEEIVPKEEVIWPQNFEEIKIKGKIFNIENLKYEDFYLYCQVKRIKEIMDEELYQIATYSLCNTTTIKILEEELDQLRRGHNFENLQKENAFLYDQLKQIEEMLVKDIEKENLKCKYYGMKPKDYNFNKLPHFEAKSKFKEENLEDKYSTPSRGDILRNQGTKISKSNTTSLGKLNNVKILDVSKTQISKNSAQNVSLTQNETSNYNFKVLPHFSTKQIFKASHDNNNNNQNTSQHINFNQIKTFKVDRNSSFVSVKNVSLDKIYNANFNILPHFVRAQPFSNKVSIENRNLDTQNVSNSQFSVLPHFDRKTNFRDNKNLSLTQNTSNNSVKDSVANFLSHEIKDTNLNSSLKSLTQDIKIENGANTNISLNFNVLPHFLQNQTFSTPQEILDNKNLSLTQNISAVSRKNDSNSPNSNYNGTFNSLPHFVKINSFRGDIPVDFYKNVSLTESLTQNTTNKHHFSSLPHFERAQNFNKTYNTLATKNNSVKDSTAQFLSHEIKDTDLYSKNSSLKSLNQDENGANIDFNVLPHFFQNQTFSTPQEISYNKNLSLTQKLSIKNDSNSSNSNYKETFNSLPHFVKINSFRGDIPVDFYKNVSLTESLTQNTTNEHHFSSLPHFEKSQNFNKTPNKFVTKDNTVKDSVTQFIIQEVKDTDLYLKNSSLKSLNQAENGANIDFNVLPHFSQNQNQTFNKTQKTLDNKNLSLTQNNSKENDNIQRVNKDNLDFNILPHFSQNQTFNDTTKNDNEFAQNWVRDFFKNHTKTIKNYETNNENRKKVLVKVFKRPVEANKNPQNEPKIHNIFETVREVIIKKYNNTV